MAISDTKKCQTLINVIGQRCIELQAIALDLKAYRTAYIAQSVDPTGTPLEGNVTAASNWIDDVDTAANAAVADGFIANIVPSHGNKALGDI